MAEKIAKYLEVTATQGGADAFVQAAITTGLIPADGFAFKLTRMVADIGPLFFSGAVDGATAQISLTRDTKAAIARYDDTDTLFMFEKRLHLATSGMAISDGTMDVSFENGIYIVEPTIYMQVDGTSTNGARTVNARLYYEEIKLSEVEILRLLNNI